MAKPKKCFSLSLFAALPLLLFPQILFADVCSEIREKPARCSERALREDQVSNSIILAETVASQLLEIEKRERRAGREFKVALISRQGTNLQKFSIINEWPSELSGKHRSVDTLVEQCRVDGQLPGQKEVDYSALIQQVDRRQSMRFSHLGLAVRNDPESKPGKGYWMVYQLLWTCEKNHSKIFKDGLGTFYLDHMSDYGAQVMVLPQDMQSRIEELLLDQKNRKSIVKNWHQSAYNAVAHWDSETEQNSNQWVLEVLAAAQRPVGQVVTREETHQILRESDYHPTQVLLSGFYSLITIPGVSKLLPNTVCLKNQKYGLSLGLGEVVSVLSIEDYLRRNKLLVDVIETKVPDELRFEPSGA